MGACMAPAAASTLEQHFTDFAGQPEEYDKIITGEMAGGDAGNFVGKAAGDAHGPQSQRLTAGGAGAVYAQQGNLIGRDAERSGHGLTQQVTRKDIGNVFRPQTRLFQSQSHGLFLEGALRLLPAVF